MPGYESILTPEGAPSKLCLGGILMFIRHRLDPSCGKYLVPMPRGLKPFHQTRQLDPSATLGISAAGSDAR